MQLWKQAGVTPGTSMRFTPVQSWLPPGSPVQAVYGDAAMRQPQSMREHKQLRAAGCPTCTMVRLSFFRREGSSASATRKGPTTLVSSTCRYTLPVLQPRRGKRVSEARGKWLQGASDETPDRMAQHRSDITGGPRGLQHSAVMLAHSGRFDMHDCVSFSQRLTCAGEVLRLSLQCSRTGCCRLTSRWRVMCTRPAQRCSPGCQCPQAPGAPPL